jgi:16S rRNA (cytosine967-C5)-methyltransferase
MPGGQPQSTSVRRLSVDLLQHWQKSGRYAADLLDATARRAELSAANTAFLHDICLTSLRHLSLLDHWIKHLTEGKSLDHRTRWLLRIGLCQLLLLEVPSHAAVNETVGCAGRSGALINAVLRRADRERAALLQERSRLPFATAYSHPEFLVRRWIKAMGKEKAQALCQWNQDPAPTYIRLNRLHEDAPARITELPGLTALEGYEDFYRCESPPRDALRQGLCYAQDPSTSHAPLMLAPRPGETVLDACAAPGGKTALLAQLMLDQGQIIACDSSAPRLQRLRENLNRLRVRCAQVHQYDFLSDTAPPFGPMQFDRILLDVPCSNTGVMRRRVDVRWRLTEQDFPALNCTQRALIKAAIPLLKVGGSLVYSTCSLDMVENQQLMREFLAAHPEFEMAESRLLFPPKEGVDGGYAARLVKKA